MLYHGDAADFVIERLVLGQKGSTFNSTKLNVKIYASYKKQLSHHDAKEKLQHECHFSFGKTSLTLTRIKFVRTKAPLFRKAHNFTVSFSSQPSKFASST